MRGRSGFHFWPRLVLALILLASNVCAPFRTTLGRAVLDSLRHDVAARSVVRVRVISPTGASQGFRALVGVGRGKPEGSARAQRTHVQFVITPVSPSQSYQGTADLSVVRPHPFLRC
jgi:hypothetical protein